VEFRDRFKAEGSADVAAPITELSAQRRKGGPKKSKRVMTGVKSSRRRMSGESQGVRRNVVRTRNKVVEEQKKMPSWDPHQRESKTNTGRLIPQKAEKNKPNEYNLEHGTPGGGSRV